MQSPCPDEHQSIIFNDLKDLLDPKDPLYRLAAKVPWVEIETGFASLYAKSVSMNPNLVEVSEPHLCRTQIMVS